MNRRSENSARNDLAKSRSCSRTGAHLSLVILHAIDSHAPISNSAARSISCSVV